MRVKNIGMSWAGQDQMLVKDGKGWTKFLSGDVKDIEAVAAAALVAKWPKCFAIVPDPEPEPVRAVPRKAAIPTSNKQIRTAPKDK